MAPDQQDTKGERTRARVVEAALATLAEDGYAAASMRRIAQRAGVAPGTIYLYVPSKAHLVHLVYDAVTERIVERLGAELGTTRAFARRLDAAMTIVLDEIAPHHAVAVEMLGASLDPASPTSPFGDASAESRDRMIAALATVVAGSDLRADAEVLEALPELLWAAVMAVMLAWSMDRSDDQRRTRALATEVVPLVDDLARASRLPVLRGQARRVLALARMAKELGDA